MGMAASGKAFIDASMWQGMASVVLPGLVIKYATIICLIYALCAPYLLRVSHG